MYIFLGIDVDNQFLKIKNKAEVIDKNMDFQNPCFTLPLHISLKASFKINKSIFDNIIEEIINYYLTIQPFKIDIYKIEMYYNIIWIRMCRNKELDKVHYDLNSILLNKYHIELHEYDLDYKYHTTLFMDNSPIKIREAYALIDKGQLPESITANEFIIGVSESGELGSYNIYKRVKRPKNS